MALSAFYNSDHLLTVTLTDAAGAPLTGATVTCSVLNSGGRPVSGGTWPATLNDEADGTYTLSLDSDVFAARVSDSLTAEIVAVSGSFRREARVPITVSADTD